MSEAIGEESKLTASVMDSLEGAMDQARASLRKTMRRLNRAWEDGKGGNHVLHLVLFAICLFFALYFWHKLWRILRWFLSWVF